MGELGLPVDVPARRRRLTAALAGQGLHDNNIFDLDDPGNRDDCFVPYVRLRELFGEHGIDLDTSDRAPNPDFVIDLNVAEPSSGPSYLLALEPPTICPANEDPAVLSRYRRVFSWNDTLVDGQHIVKLNLPNDIRVWPIDGMGERPLFACIIARNKIATVADPRDLYAERIQAIRWFEQNDPGAFALYGLGWDQPAMRRGLPSRILRQLPLGALRRPPFPSYRGKVDRKTDILSRCRFNFAYENTAIPGYVTEKIFDAMFAGCVPVYWGADNITDYVPGDCFIDRRKFADTGSVVEWLRAIDEREYRIYQENIACFLSSPAARAFASEAFARTIADSIVTDLTLER
jgi:hypothetical protein